MKVGDTLICINTIFNFGAYVTTLDKKYVTIDIYNDYWFGIHNDEGRITYISLNEKSKLYWKNFFTIYNTEIDLMIEFINRLKINVC